MLIKILITVDLLQNIAYMIFKANIVSYTPVSYTHLDVYKRQRYYVGFKKSYRLYSVINQQ